MRAAAILCTGPIAHCRQHERPPRPASLRIYEAHVGMSSEQPKVASYLEFRGAAMLLADSDADSLQAYTVVCLVNSTYLNQPRIEVHQEPQAHIGAQSMRLHVSCSSQLRLIVLNSVHMRLQMQCCRASRPRATPPCS